MADTEREQKNLGHDAREDEPLAEADAVACDVPAPDCELTAMERQGQAHESEASLREEIFETFQPETTPVVASPDDGMPIPANERARDDLPVAHPFTIETVVCVEDERLYIELFADELEARSDWRVVEKKRWLGKPLRLYVPALAPDAAADLFFVRRRYDDHGQPTMRGEKFLPEELTEKWGVKVVEQDCLLIPVRPIRERCKHYKRQNMAADEQPTPGEFGHHILFRNCTMRKSVGGAFMTLRDEAMYACDYREPFDHASVDKYLDAPDRDRLASKRHLKLIRPFNLE